MYSECLGNVHSFQSNLVQIVNEYLQSVVKSRCDDISEMEPILESLTLLLPVAPVLVRPVTVFLSSIPNPFENWLSSSDLKPWTVLYRLLPHIVDGVRGVWNWKSLFYFLSCNNLKVRYYAVQIVCSLLNKTENERFQMETLLGVNSTCVYQSTSLLDVQKEERCYQETIQNVRREILQSSNSTTQMELEGGEKEEEEENDNPSMQVEANPSSPLSPPSSVGSQQYVEVCGYILPCNSRGTTTVQATSQLEPFVMTPTSEKNLQRICLQMQDATPILLQGTSGCGKTRLFQELAHLTQNDDYVQLYLDDQTDSKTLIGNYVCTDVPGEFVFQPGTLMQSISQGKWIIIEDIDKIPFDIVSTLLPIIEKGELSIPSRGLTVKVHKNFRLFGTSCHNCSSSNSPINSFLSNHWHVVDVGDFTNEDLGVVIAQRFPALRENIVGFENGLDTIHFLFFSFSHFLISAS